MRFDWLRNSNTLIAFGVLIILLVYASYFIMGEDSVLQIFDGLDSNHVYLKLGGESKTTVGSQRMFAQPVGGVPAYPDRVKDIQSLLYKLFDPYYADVVNRILISLLAYAGMLLLISHLFREFREQNGFDFYRIVTSLIFSLCWFWPYAGISVAGLPLIFYAYNTSDSKFLRSILIAVVYALYSSLPLVGIFLIPVLALFEFIRIINKSGSLKRVLLLVMLGVIYLLDNLPMVMSVLKPLFVSHRADIDMAGVYPSIRESALFALKSSSFSTGHNSGYPTLIITAFLITLILAKVNKVEVSKAAKGFLLAYLGIVAVTFIFGNELVVSVQEKIPVLGMLQLQRFYWLLLPIQYLFLFETFRLLNRVKLKKAALALLVLQLLFVGYKITFNYRQLAKEIIGRENKNVSYSQYYSPELYGEIEDYIARPQSSYRVVSVGLDPAIALYNGFYTIDGYYSGGYPLEHKKEFGKMMEDELAKNSTLASTFYDWGSPCYLFSDDIDRQIGYPGGYGVPIIREDSKLVIRDLDINPEILSSMNCQYVFSALPIENAAGIDLEFERSFTDDESPYEVFLYSVGTYPGR